MKVFKQEFYIAYEAFGLAFILRYLSTLPRNAVRTAYSTDILEGMHMAIVNLSSRSRMRKIGLSMPWNLRKALGLQSSQT